MQEEAHWEAHVAAQLVRRRLCRVHWESQRREQVAVVMAAEAEEAAEAFAAMEEAARGWAPVRWKAA